MVVSSSTTSNRMGFRSFFVEIGAARGASASAISSRAGESAGYLSDYSGIEASTAAGLQSVHAAIF